MKCDTCSEEVGRVVGCSCGASPCHECAKKSSIAFGRRARCAGCGRPMTQGSISENFGETWTRTAYRKHKKGTSDEEEKALLPTTLAKALERRKLSKRIADKKAEKANEVRILLRSAGDEDLAWIGQAVKEMREETGLVEFSFGCPAEGCGGLVEASELVCATCMKPSCGRCRGVYSLDHVCDEDEVTRIEIVEKGSRPCLKCSRLLARKPGCTWDSCPGCRSPFGRNQGVPAVEHVPSPYVEAWAASMGVDLEKVQGTPCGGLVGVSELPGDEMFEVWPMLEFVRIAAEDGRNGPEDTEGVREAFLLGDVGEEEWLDVASSSRERNEAREVVSEVLGAFVEFATCLFRLRVLGDRSLAFPERLGILKKEVNETLKEELSSFDVVPPAMVGRDWEWGSLG